MSVCSHRNYRDGVTNCSWPAQIDSITSIAREQTLGEALINVNIKINFVHWMSMRTVSRILINLSSSY